MVSGLRSVGDSWIQGLSSTSSLLGLQGVSERVFFFGVIFFCGGGYFCFFVRFFWFLLGNPLFSYGFSVISLGFAWFFPGKTLFLYGFRVISLGFFWFFVGENTIFNSFRVISLCFLVFRRKNTIFLRLPCHFLRFSEGEHTLPWLFLWKIRFS